VDENKTFEKQKPTEKDIYLNILQIWGGYMMKERSLRPRQTKESHPRNKKSGWLQSILLLL
jgi:hypothetical protein